MADYQKAFDDIAASLGGGGQTLAASLGADVKTALKPSSGIVDKLSAYAAKSQASTNSLPFLNIIKNNSPVPGAAPALPDSPIPVNWALGVAVLVALVFLLRRG